MQRRSFLKALAGVFAAAAVKPVSALGSTLNPAGVGLAEPILEFNHLTALPKGEWTHVALTKSVDGHARVFINSALQAVKRMPETNADKCVSELMQACMPEDYTPAFSETLFANVSPTFGERDFTIEFWTKANQRESFVDELRLTQGVAREYPKKAV